MGRFFFKDGQLTFRNDGPEVITVEEAQVIALMQVVGGIQEIKTKLSGIESLIALK